MSDSLYERHRQTLEDALAAIRARTHFSAYPEVPSGRVYGENARAEGQAAFQARLGTTFTIDQPTSGETVGAERSPYGIDLNVSYPAPDIDAMLAAAHSAMTEWKRADVETRVGVALEILHRLNQRSFEMGFAVMHTTGQGFMMAFQAGGPHAQDRALEAIAYAWDEMARTPRSATWTKRIGKEETVTLEKTFRVMPRGIAVTLGCSTFPTWNTYPSLFADLVTGNAVIVKPHPGAVLPLAITVEIAREVLREQGFDTNLVTIAVDTQDAPIAQDLVTRPEVRIVDYTGGSSFGSWVESHASQAVVYTEKAGVNSVILDSIENLRGVTGNLAFSLSLYSGQMCTSSQNIFIPRDGIQVDGRLMSFDEVAGSIVKAIDWLLGEPARGAEILGAIQNPATVDRIDAARSEGGRILRESTPVENEHFPKARVRSPLVVAVDSADERQYMREMFGPMVYIVATDDTEHSLSLASRIAREQGAITSALYSTDDDVVSRAEEIMADAGTPLSSNLVGSIWVNQSAAFSDFHVSGANPSGNATLCDGAFVSGRFRVVQSRALAPAPVSSEA